MPTNFLEASSFLVSPFNLMTTELNTLADANSATSSVGGSSGVFNQGNTSQGIWGVAHFKSGGAFTPAAGGYIAGWFLYSPDGGSTFEKVVSNTDMPRSPDFTIPLFNSAYASSDISQSSGIIRLPWWSWKLFVMSHAGASMPSSGNVIQLGSLAIQY
jgi:hypothetical protein